MKFMKTFAILIFVQSALFLSACNMGLGDSVDVKGPTVTIVSPEARENVSAKFEIHGIVTDDFAVGTVTVELDGNTWRHTGSRWEYKAKGTDNFVSDTESEWISESKKSVKWTVKNATVSSEGGGTFTIEVRAIDESGNSSEESTKTRDVVIDKNAPKITISSPTMFQESDLNPLLELEDYKDITKVTQFLTGDFKISGKTEEENAIKYIEVLIKEAGMDDGDYLFKRRIVQSESDKTSDSDKVVDSLRSWEIPVKLADEYALKALDEKKHILKIFTSSGDTAGNDSGMTFQGYACMWKEADKPWIDIMLGDERNPKYVYSGSSILGNAYDDTAIKFINVTFQKKGDSTLTEEQIYSANDDEDENNVCFEIFSPTDSAEYYIEITATDKNGNKSDIETGWINVVDKTFPSIEISHTEGGNLFCDRNGNFTFKIISKDETEVKSLKMAYIMNSTDTVEYSNPSSEKWNNVSQDLKDLKEKVYVITPKNTGKTIYENGLTRKIYENEFAINIFDHLGIDGNNRKLTNQTFVFRVEDNGDGKGNANALTSTYAIQGDIESPKIEFTKLEYYSFEGDKPITRTQEGGDLLPAFGERTFVKVYGKISDNSSYLWGNSKARPTLELKANGYTIQAADISVNYNDGSFVATARSLTGASLVFEGNVTDFGGNTETQKYSFLVDSQTPRVEYISALNTNGFYKVDDTIDIFIRFNKKLDFSGDTRITLNNDKIIEKSESTTGIGTNDILFKYTIAAGDDVETLSVIKAEFSNVTSDGADVTKEIQASIDLIIKDGSYGKNLGQMKNISVVTSLPKIIDDGIQFDETKNTLIITYDKAVAKGSGEVTITQQKSVNGAYNDGVDKVPAVLTEAEGRTLFEKSKEYNLEQYYDLTTNGALKDKDGNFNADLTSKYVLKYEYDSDTPAVVKAYEATGAYKLSQDVRAQGVSIDSTGKIVEVKFNSPLPCKGATYKITVPYGFVQDKNGGSDFKVRGVEEMSYTAKGIEKPVIRINKKETVVKNWEATQPLTTNFKVDCETPGVKPSWSYKCYTRNALALIGRGSNQEPLYFDYLGYNGGDITNRDKTPQITGYGKFPYEKIERKEKDVGYNNEIGTTNWREGLEYHITANANGVESYAVAYRTVIEINGLGDINNNNEGLFVIGGDSPSGSNTVSGFPTSWDKNKPGQTRLFTKAAIGNYLDEIVLRPEAGNRYIFYFTSWAITKDYYFMVLKGYMNDNANGTPGNGPYQGIMAQNSWVSYFAKYPINPGGYIRILNGTSIYDSIDEPVFKETERKRTGNGGDGAYFDGVKIIPFNK